MTNAQLLSFGVKGGIPATDAVPAPPSSAGLLDTGRLTVGPTLEIHLFRGFSVEFDALYRGYRLYQNFAFQTIPQGVTFVPAIATISSSFQQNAKVWDFPMLLKYRFGTRPSRPFVDAGYLGSHRSTDETSSFQCLASADACTAAFPFVIFRSPRTFSTSAYRNGGTAGVGLEYKLGKFKIAPEVRYSRFEHPSVDNQATVLIGVTF